MVLVAGGERGGVERAHRGVLAGGEREVDVLRERPLIVDQREAVVLAPEVRAAGLVVPQPDPGVGRDGRVEALGRREVGDADPQVVDAAVGHGALALAVHGLDAVAVRVEQEPAVVVGSVLRARPGRAVVAVPASTPACQKASTAARLGARNPTCRPRVTGCSRSVGPMAQSSHSTSSASAWLGSTPSTERTVR